MLERTGAITNKVLEPITFVLAYPTVCILYTLNEGRIRCKISYMECMAFWKDVYFYCRKLYLISAVDLEAVRHFPGSIS